MNTKNTAATVMWYDNLPDEKSWSRLWYDYTICGPEYRLSMLLALDDINRVETIRFEKLVEADFRFLQNWFDRDRKVRHEVGTPRCGGIR
jgi:hypothetical protein